MVVVVCQKCGLNCCLLKLNCCFFLRCDVKKNEKNSDAEINILVGSCFIGVQMLPAILCRSTICSGFGVGRGGFGEFPFPKTWLCFALKHFGGYVTDETCLLVREAKLRQLPYTKSHVEFR